MKRVWRKIRRAYLNSWLDAYQAMIRDPKNAFKYSLVPVLNGLILPIIALMLLLLAIEFSLAYFANIPRQITSSFTIVPAVIIPFYLWASYAARALGTFGLFGAPSRITIDKKRVKLEAKLKALTDA